MSIQNKIEQIAKEYIIRKNIYEERKNKINENKKNFAQLTLELSEEDMLKKSFDDIGSVDLMQIDINQIKVQLYNYIKLAEDIVEIPQDIKGLVEDYKPIFIYAATGELVNKEAYEKYRLQFEQSFRVQNFLGNSKEFQKIIN